MNSNQTSQLNAEKTFIQNLCHEHGFDPVGDQSTAAEALRQLQQSIVHLRKQAPTEQWHKTINTLVQLESQLEVLAAVEKEIKQPQKTGQNPQPPPNQPSPDRPETGQNRPNPFPWQTNDEPEPSALQEAAEDLQLHLHQRTRFASLTDQEQDAVIKLFKNHDSRTIVTLIAQPPPVGFNFKISKSALNEFRLRYNEKKTQQRHAEKVRQAEQLLGQSADPFDAFQKAAQRALQIQCLAAVEDATLDTVDQMLAPILKLRKQLLAERKQTQLENHQNK